MPRGARIAEERRAPRGRRRAMMAGVVGALVALAPALAHAAEPTLGARPLSTLILLGALSLLPFVLVMVTSFVRIAVVLSILRSALGTPQLPPTTVITGLAVILTIYVMAPTGSKVYEAVKPVVDVGAGQGLVSAGSADALYQAALRAREPVREFLIAHSSPRDRAMFRDLSRRMRPKEQRAAVGERDLLVVVPAFVIGELAAAFQIGFLLFIPFLVVDMVVANILLALGMHMLSPTTISLPFKLLLFVIVDGWHLLTQGLVLSYV
jgi:type III secretion protein R